MIQVRYYFGDWKTVDLEAAKRFIKVYINHGGRTSAEFINGVRLRGISVQELMQDEYPAWLFSKEVSP